METFEIPIIVEQVYNATLENVWSAITEVDQMRQWYFDKIQAFEPEIGYKTRFTIDLEERSFIHDWEVTEVQPRKRIAYNWKYGGYVGDSRVSFELSQLKDQVKLRLTHIGQETFPRDVPEFSRENGVAGWTYFIQKSLKEYLEKKKSS